MLKVSKEELATALKDSGILMSMKQKNVSTTDKYTFWPVVLRFEKGTSLMTKRATLHHLGEICSQLVSFGSVYALHTPLWLTNDALVLVIGRR